VLVAIIVLCPVVASSPAEAGGATVTDAVGDGGPGGDIIAAWTNYSGPFFDLMVQVENGVDPATSASWKDGSTRIEATIFLDNGDTVAVRLEYDPTIRSIFSETYYPNSDRACRGRGNPGLYRRPDVYAVPAQPPCFGDASPVRFAVSYITPSRTDRAPDRGTSDPVDHGSTYGQDYWLVGRDGGVFSFRQAEFHGSMGGLPLNQPIVGMVGTGSGRGYWLVAADGGVFSFGDATFYGSTGDIQLNQPIVGIERTVTGHGYYLVASDGGIFTFGDAVFQGSTGDVRLNRPIVGMAAHPSGLGYWLVAADGGVFSFGLSKFYGSLAGSSSGPVVGIGADDSGEGYVLASRSGGIFGYGSRGERVNSRQSPTVGMAVSNSTTIQTTTSNGQVFETTKPAGYSSPGLSGQRLSAPIVGIANTRGA
jgi:hypothetical protein